jgi:hypothetical protein
MKKSRKRLLIVSLVGAALVCSLVVILSESGYVFSVSREASSEEFVPKGPETLPPLTSHEEAIFLANEFLKEKLGNEFFCNHFTVIGLDETPHLPYTWVVLYHYTYKEYIIDTTVAVDIGPIPENASRILVNISTIILEPQEILVSEEHVKNIAQEYGLEPPYKELELFCNLRFHRLCWKIVKEDAESTELEGLVIDAENGTVLESWINRF